MCHDCEDGARENVENAIRLLGHDASLLDPVLRADMESNDYDPIDVDNFYIQIAIARLAFALALRSHKPPCIVLGEIAGTMMAAQMETDAINDFINATGISLN